MDLDEEIDRLFALDPDDFVAARDDLAKRLRGEKRRDEAAEVKALRRPTVVAWAVNQLARQATDDLDELLARGEALREAQRAALAGDAGPLRTATAERRKSVDGLRRRASTILRGRGNEPSEATLDQVASTLEAASTNPETGAEVRRGRLSKELAAPSGFGDLSLDDALIASVTADRDDRRRAEELAAAAAAARDRAGEARRKAAAAAAEVERLERQLDEARRAAQTAEEAAAEAEADAEAAEQAVGSADG